MSGLTIGRGWRAINVLGPSVVVGIVGAVVWQWCAEPSSWQVSGDGAILTESASRDEFPVLLWFMGIGFCLSLLIGVVAEILLRIDWRDLLVVGAGALVASVVTWQLGIVLGPPDPASVEGLGVGDLVQDQLAVTSIVGFFAWPVGALLGVLIGSVFDRDRHDLAIADTTASVSDTRS